MHTRWNFFFSFWNWKSLGFFLFLCVCQNSLHGVLYRREAKQVIDQSCHKLSKINKTKLWTSTGFYNINKNGIQYSITMRECRTNLTFACTFTVKNRLRDLLHQSTSLHIPAFDCPFDFLFALEEKSSCVSIKTNLLKYCAIRISYSFRLTEAFVVFKEPHFSSTCS